MKTYLISQPFGLGDVIFSMSAIRKLKGHGDVKIIWPVLPEYVEGCNRAYPEIHFKDYTKMTHVDFNRKERYKIDSETEYIPLRWQDVPLKECMKNKYGYFGYDWNEWKEKSHIKRDLGKEYQLARDLGIKFGEKYNLINNSFGCTKDGKVAGPGSHQISSMFWENTIGKNVDFKIIEGYSMFDWCAVIENATNIYTVSTSSLYLFELLDMQAESIHLYLRKPFEKNHDNYSYLLSKEKNYILHD